MRPLRSLLRATTTLALHPPLVEVPAIDPRYLPITRPYRPSRLYTISFRRGQQSKRGQCGANLPTSPLGPLATNPSGILGPGRHPSPLFRQCIKHPPRAGSASTIPNRPRRAAQLQVRVPSPPAREYRSRAVVYPLEALRPSRPAQRWSSRPLNEHIPMRKDPVGKAWIHILILRPHALGRACHFLYHDRLPLLSLPDQHLTELLLHPMLDLGANHLVGVWRAIPHLHFEPPLLHRPGLPLAYLHLQYSSRPLLYILLNLLSSTCSIKKYPRSLIKSASICL